MHNRRLHQARFNILRWKLTAVLGPEMRHRTCYTFAKPQFDDPENEAFPLFDAKNAFTLLNRRTALKNAKALCPFLHVALKNSYSLPYYLYIGKSTILVQESTTQGEPLAMAMYGIAILPPNNKTYPTITPGRINGLLIMVASSVS